MNPSDYRYAWSVVLMGISLAGVVAGCWMFAKTFPYFCRHRGPLVISRDAATGILGYTCASCGKWKPTPADHRVPWPGGNNAA